jgi:hypothetical protein
LTKRLAKNKRQNLRGISRNTTPLYSLELAIFQTIDAFNPNTHCLGIKKAFFVKK